MALDLEGESITPLTRFDLGFPPLQPTWNPSLSKGIASRSSDICASLVWLTPDRAEPALFTLRAGDREIPLREQTTTAGSCTKLARADWPAWSWDGRTIAFFASPDSIGIDGMARLDVPWNLYLVNAEGTQANQVLAGILHPRSLHWSPDSRTLAFSGEVTGQGSGIWSFQPDTRGLTRISEKSVSWLAWSPSGDRITGIYNPDVAENPPQREILIFTVPGEDQGL